MPFSQCPHCLSGRLFWIHDSSAAILSIPVFWKLLFRTRLGKPGPNSRLGNAQSGVPTPEARFVRTQNFGLGPLEFKSLDSSPAQLKVPLWKFQWNSGIERKVDSGLSRTPPGHCNRDPNRSKAETADSCRSWLISNRAREVRTGVLD
jgi:hypothetical protein